ncbi:hypothetical protein FIBSPDRAFT_1035341 [Athelia psychrophila]|uniref:Uncharacterized protein n=1 Tax=Athelia psychrophila TaxID=1759441 RepID=A0A166WZ87_9AGAM|nr:hypothetical protein FIBSPDRAFT_1035341 [Fibularhizoctonia sp. CBS 109695]
MATLATSPALPNLDTDANSKGVFGSFKSRFLGGSSRPTKASSSQQASRYISSPPYAPLKSKSPSTGSIVAPSSKTSVAPSAKSSPSSGTAPRAGRSPASSTLGRPSAAANARANASKQLSSGRMSTYSTVSRTSQGSNKSQGNRAPSPPLMYASFGFKGPPKKPRPLPLDPTKMRRKPSDRGGKQNQSSFGNSLRAGELRPQRNGSQHSSPTSSFHYPSTISSSPRTLSPVLADDISALSSISSFRAGSPTDTVGLEWNSEFDSPIFSPSVGGDISPVSPIGSQYAEGLEVSDESGAETPLVTEAMERESQRNRNMRKLARMLGESVTELVLDEERQREVVENKEKKGEEIQEIVKSEWNAVSAAELSAEANDTVDITEDMPERRPRVPAAARPRPEFVYSISHAADATSREEGSWVTVETSLRFSKSQEDINRSPTPRLTNARAGISVQIPGKGPARPPRSKQRPSTAAGHLPSPTNSSFSNGSDRTQQGLAPSSNPSSAASIRTAPDDQIPPSWIERKLRSPPPRAASLNRRPATAAAASPSPSPIIDISHESNKDERTAFILRALSPSRSITNLRSVLTDFQGARQDAAPPPLRTFERDPTPARPAVRSPRAKAHQRSSSSGVLQNSEGARALSRLTTEGDGDLSTASRTLQRSMSLHRPHTAGELPAPRSPGPFALKTDFLAPRSPTGGVRRRERKEGWSGEWNQDDMQDVIRKLRDLR